MLRKLALGALGVGGVAAALVGVSLGTANTELCVVTLDANGGSFTELETNVYSRTVSYGDPYGMVFSQEPITNKNFDLKGWTRTAGGTDFIAADSPVTNDAVCYAKWERSAIQRFELENGVFTDEGGEIVAQFPAAFYGVATVAQTNAHVITFTSPTNETWRISFDPQIGWYRICANIRIIHGGDTNNFGFGASTSVPVSFDDYEYEFTAGERYRIEIDYAFGEKAWSDIKAPYVFGIGLGGHAVKFDAQEYGTVRYYPEKFKDPGANMSTNYPFGYLPSVVAVNPSVSFLGWFSEKKGGVQISTSTLVGTNDIYYAHWKLPAYKYYVKFYRDNDAAQGRQMPTQTFTSDVAQALTLNRYYLAQHKFAGWATEPKGKKVYSDGETVVNICDIPEGTCPLYAVWEQTPGENHFTVSRGVTNFENVAISNLTTYVNGTGSVPEFYMTITNSADLRVSLDPATSCNRMNAKLIVEMRQSGGWTNVCEVADLATNEVRHTFVAAQYRFAVTNAPSSYGYVVGLGATGAQVSFDSYGVGVAPTSLSSSLSFNWTTNTPFGYLPTLSSSSYGAFLGWFEDKDITLTNRLVTTTNVVVGADTVYAHWANQPYYVAFDGQGATGGKMAPQAFAWNVPQALNYNQYYKRGQRFVGWEDRIAGTNYTDHAVVSNLCATAGGTNTLHAIWEPSTGTNVYYVTAGMTNFANIVLSPREPSFFMGHGDTACFTVTPANLGEATKCRVSIDPDGGFRTNALLTIDRALAAATRVAWTNVCTVTDLSEKEVTCTFSTNYQYRFTISGVAPSYAYSVGVGAAGSQYTFEPCGGTVSPSAPVKNLSFNWTVDAPLGYLPPLTNDVKYGTYAWHYTPNANETNLVFATNHVAASATTCYAHWSKGVIVPIVLDWNLTSYGVATNVVVTNYYGQGTKMSLPRPSYENWGFLGWTTNRLATSGWLPDTVVISNTATYFGQWSKEWRLSVYNGGWSIDGYNGTWVGPLALPSYIAPKNVYAVGASAFKGQSLITSLAIPAGVTFVGDAAFEECAALKSVVFPSVYPESEYAEDGFLDNEIELGTDLFLNCTALTDVQLPLGVWRLPDGIFCGCTALTAMDMPYTIREIGVGAFNHCNHLQELVVTEGVDALESCAFETCTRMRKISFIGNPPESVEGDIFKGTQRNLLVGYLQNMCETAKAYCGGTWPALPGTWPEGSEYARTLTWIGEGLYPRYKVSFNHNDGDTPATSPVTPVLYHAGRVFGLMAPTEDVMGEGFSGWWTQPVGGRKIGNYREVTAGMTVYAHWETMVEEPEIGSRSDEDYPVYWDPENEDFTGFYSADDDLFYYSACAFNGIVVDEGGVMAGTIAFTFREGGMTEDGMSAPVTASVAWSGGKSLSLSGRVDADGLLVAKSRTWAFADTTVTKSGIYGTLVDETEGVTYKVYAARNRYAMSTDAARTVVLTALQATRGTWHVVLQTESAESEEEGAAAYAEGYTTLAITIAGMGQATIEGTTGDGAKISTTATLIVGDGCAALPVVVRPYSGRGGFSFFIWFAWQSDGSIGEDETRIHGLTAWDATRAAHPFTATFYGAPDPDPSDFPVTFIDDKRYEGGAMFDCEDVSAELVIKGTTWKVVGENPNKVKLTYQAATGLFTGSFTVETSEGKTARATVSGAFTDRILEDCTDLYHGYGTAVISGVGSFPIEVTTTE